MMKSRLLSAVYTVLFGLVTISIQPAFAASGFETDAMRDTASGTASDPQGPATTGSILSEVIVPLSDGGDISFAGNGFARGAANDAGAGAVAVDGAFFNGDPTLNSLTATSILISEITNTTGEVASFAYDFFVPGPRLTLADFAGLSDTDDPTNRVFFDFRVSLDFGSGFLPFVVSQGELMGGSVSHSLGTAGTDTLGSTFFTDGTYPGNIFGYQFDDLESAVTGFLPDGQTVAVKSQLFVSLAAPGFETGGAASIGDPLNLTSGAFSGSLSIVPVPAAAWLFGSGLLGLIGIAKRKKA